MRIQTTIALTAILFFVTLYAPAQNRWNVGAFGGVNATTKDTGFGWNAGAIGQFDLGKQWVVQGQLGGFVERNLLERSYSTHDDGDGSSVDTKYTERAMRSWLELSTVFGYHPRLGKKVGALVGIGFSTRLLLHATSEVSLSRTSGQGTNTGSIDFTDALYRWNYGLPLQLGMDFKSGNHKIAWILEYYLPFRDLFKPSQPNSEAAFDFAWVENDSRNHAVALKVVYLIPLGK